MPVVIGANGGNDITATGLRVNAIQNTSGIEQYLTKAWVNFNGTGTVAIRAAGNVSSITDNGTGDYTVNFTSAMADANYAVTFGVYNDGSAGSNANFNAVMRTVQPPTASAVRVYTGAPSNGVLYDTAGASVAIFR